MVEKFMVNAQPSTGGTSSGKYEYFATADRQKIGKEVMNKVDQYYNYLQQFGRMRAWRRSYDYYYRGWMRGARVNRTGKQDEYWTTNVNEYRNILLHLTNQTTAQKLVYEPQAKNSDYKSQAQTIVALNVLDYYNRALQLDHLHKKACEYSLVFGEGHLTLEWNAKAGQDFMAGDQGEVIKSGDLECAVLTPMDVVRDMTAQNYEDCQWKVIRKFKNRFDLVASYPDLADKIMNTATNYETLRNLRFSVNKQIDTDFIPVWTFYHDRSPILPQGRMVQLLADDLILLDGPLPYRTVPDYRMTPDDQINSVFGYTVGFDLLPLQEALDGLYSIILTNQASFGVQNIAMPTGANIAVNALGEGLNLITYDPKFGAPSALNLVATPAEIFKFIDVLTARMETIAGLNSVVRGNPEASLKSGAALALVASQSIQFNSGLAQSYANIVEDVGTGIVNNLQDFAKSPRMIAIAGKNNAPLMMEFKGDDIVNIDRVSVNLGNPLSRTIAGKLQIADNLLQSQLIKTPEEYITVATTGRLEPLYEGPQRENLLIKAENERLGQGEQVAALMTDGHKQHILEHMVVLSSPSARENPQIVQAALGHIQQHIQLLQTGDPMILSLNGQPVPPPPPAPSPVTGTPEVMNATNPVVQQAQKVNLPNMPTNPLSGQEFNPQTGGLPPGMAG